MTFARPGSHCWNRHTDKEAHMPAPTLVIGAPCWIDLYSSDTDKATAFYRDLFGWNGGAAAGGVRRLLHVHEGRQARRRLHAQRRRAGVPGRVGRPSHDRRRRGGRRRRRRSTAARSSSRRWSSARTAARRWSRIRAARMIGAWQPEPAEGLRGDRRARDAGLVRAPHARVRADRRFYRDVFGWDTHAMSDTDEFRYTTLGEGEGQLAGIMDDSPYPAATSRRTGRSTSP